MMSRFSSPLALSCLAILVAGSASTRSVEASSIAIAGSTYDVYDPEAGGSIPGNMLGIVNGLVSVTGVDAVTFTFGSGLVPGETGHGNSPYLNNFWVGPSEAFAEAAGWVFCAQPEASCAGGKASTVGDSFTVPLAHAAVGGNLLFGFSFGPDSSSVLTNGSASTALGAYLATCSPLSTLTANAGPCDVAYLGLSDRPYPDIDHDFQDLAVTISTVPAPEPLSLVLLGTGLLGLGSKRLRRRS